MTRLIDISPVVFAATPVWPGDVPFSMHKSVDIHAGGHLDLGAITTTLHIGAHADAHVHYDAAGSDAANMPLDAYYGPCQVVAVDARRGQRFGAEAIAGGLAGVRAPRVLLKTGTFPDPTHWNTDFAAPEPALIDALADAGTVLVGFDTPSTDLFDSKDLPAHKRLAARDVCNLEGLVLRDVAPGDYTLIALPLRIEGADASPVRAVLVA